MCRAGTEEKTTGQQTAPEKGAALRQQNGVMLVTLTSFIMPQLMGLAFFSLGLAYQAIQTHIQKKKTDFPCTLQSS